MRSRKKIVAVSYLNTIPFIYGISHWERDLSADLLLSEPSGCASIFKEQKCDIALLPIAAARDLNDCHILDSFCIGASGPVRSVALLSSSPLDKISKVYLDPHSQTSVLLVRILAEKHWQISPQWLPLDNFSNIDPSDKDAAWVLIGDKVFDYETKFEHNYDLAQAWIEMTGLPFTFAAWVARNNISKEYIEEFERALCFGVENISSAVACSEHKTKSYAQHYLTHNIDYLFDSQKHRAMELFWQEGMRIEPLINPG